MDKLERVARAIAYSGAVPEHREWEELLPETRRHYLQQAQAAIAALEPVTVREVPLLELAEAMQDLLDRPLGVVPASAEKYYDGRTGVFTAELIARSLAERGE